METPLSLRNIQNHIKNSLLKRGEELVFIPMFDFIEEETKEEPPLYFMREFFNMRIIHIPINPSRINPNVIPSL
jgi:hypothetical protein